MGRGWDENGTRDRNKILSHELTHVVQQNKGSYSDGSIDVSRPHDPQESEASKMSEVAESLTGGGGKINANNNPHISKSNTHRLDRFPIPLPGWGSVKYLVLKYLMMILQ